MQSFNQFLDALSNYLAHRKGLLLIVAIVLVLANLVLQIIPGAGWLASSQLFLNLGVIIGLVGVLLAWAL
jgi:hypothetical protein